MKLSRARPSLSSTKSRQTRAHAWIHKNKREREREILRRESESFDACSGGKTASHLSIMHYRKVDARTDRNVAVVVEWHSRGSSDIRVARINFHGCFAFKTIYIYIWLCVCRSFPFSFERASFRAMEFLIDLLRGLREIYLNTMLMKNLPGNGKLFFFYLRWNFQCSIAVRIRK